MEKRDRILLEDLSSNYTELLWFTSIDTEARSNPFKEPQGKVTLWTSTLCIANVGLNGTRRELGTLRQAQCGVGNWQAGKGHATCGLPLRSFCPIHPCYCYIEVIGVFYWVLPPGLNGVIRQFCSSWFKFFHTLDKHTPKRLDLICCPKTLLNGKPYHFPINWVIMLVQFGTFCIIIMP